MLRWFVRRTRLPLLTLPCLDCPSESATTGRGRFRVNANRKLLDVWLLVRCVSCDRTRKLTVHERTPVGAFEPAELRGYRVNDPALVAARLLDPALARRCHFTLDWTDAWRLDTHPVPLDQGWPVRVEVVLDDPVPVRPDRIVAHGLGLTRPQVRRRVKSDRPLGRPTVSGFTFTLLAEG
ncbi:DUF1062 domain-containing protein [Micromonospora mirobrigensis]|uniref:DUF1062 domain-containing protein n=1 Tax=Micromonospora mirobrigensis TaxID=262898 RepID=UPI001FDFD076|nr:DUF1062 domain-containing protein [Micromonospora mirobrigensis]